MKSYAQQPGYNKERARKLATASGKRAPKWQPKLRYATIDAGTDQARLAIMPPGWKNRHERREQARQYHLTRLKQQRAFVRRWFEGSNLRARPRRRNKPYRRDR